MQPRSLLGVIVESLGIYAFVVSLCALIAFVLILMLVLRGKGPLVGSAILLTAPLPVVVGLFGAVQTGLTSSHAIALSANPSGIAEPATKMLIIVLYSLVVALPAIALAIVGSSYCALRGEDS
jgi:hypothetical protein